MKRFSPFLIVTLFLFCITSCTIEKRHFFKGYHVDWHTARKQVSTSSEAMPVAEAKNHPSSELQVNEVEGEVDLNIIETEVFQEQVVAPIAEQSNKKAKKSIKQKRGYVFEKAKDMLFSAKVDAGALADPENKSEKVHPGAIIGVSALAVSLVASYFVPALIALFLLAFVVSFMTHSDFKNGDPRRGRKLNSFVLGTCIVLSILAVLSFLAFLLFFTTLASA